MGDDSIHTPKANGFHDKSSSLTISEDEHLRSQYIRHLINTGANLTPKRPTSFIPHTIVQFWNDATTIPEDVQECINSWRTLNKHGFEHILFDDESARRFIVDHFDYRHVRAFEQCRHPAMRSDYFRLCFIAKKGGFYVDADDVYQGGYLESWFEDDQLKLHPLCYSSKTSTMVPSVDFLSNQSESPELIFYINNNPLIAPSHHPAIRMALERSTQMLLVQKLNATQDVQSTTGPGNLTASLVKHSVELNRAGKNQDFTFITNWDVISVSKWPLGYRNDERNWRLWDGRNR